MAVHTIPPPLLHDLLVVGAGPAGAAAARMAARAGLSVLLLDKDRFPRHKPCAGALSQQALDALEAMDAPLPPELVEGEFRGGHMYFDDVHVEAFHPYAAGVLVQRTRFDHHLLEQAAAAGAVVRTGCRVTALLPVGQRVLARCQAKDSDAPQWHAARYALVAEGAAGRLKLNVRRPDRPHEYTFCLCADIPLDPATAASEPLVMHFGLPRAGYGWIFPRRADASVGLGELGSHAAAVPDLMARFLAAMGKTAPRPAGHKIPLGGLRRPVAKGRVLLAGDAAGFADALLGEGIAFALRSGQLAAQAVVHHLRAGAPPPERAYPAACHAAFGRELRHTLYLSLGLRHLPRRLMRTVLTDREALLRYIDIMAGRNTYTAFTHWLARRLPRYVWRAVVGN